MPGRTQRIPLPPKPGVIGAGCVGLVAALLLDLTGNAAAPPAAQQTPPGVDQQQVEQAISRMMGRGTAPQPRPAGGIEVVVGTGHSATIVAVAISADGRYVLTSGFDSTTRLWDTAAGQEVRSIPSAGLTPALALGFNPGGARAFVAYGEATELIDTNSGAVGARLEGGSLTPLLVNSSGQVASVQLQMGVALIEPSSGRTLWSVPGTERLQQLALSDDGTRLALRPASAVRSDAQNAPPARYEVQLWDLSTRRLHNRVTVEQRPGPGLSSALSPDGRLLAVEVGDGNLQLYDTTSGVLVKTLATGLAARPTAKSTLAFSPKGTLLAFASIDGFARLWRAPDYTLIASPAASALSFSSDGRQLILGKAEGGAPVFYDLESGRETPIAQGSSEVTDLSLIGGGTAAATAAGSGGARVWDLATGQLLASLPCPDAGNARSVAASSVQRVLAIGCADGSISLTELAPPYTSRVLRPAEPKHAATSSFMNVLVRFSEDGRRLVTVVGDELSAWDPASGQPLRRLALPPAPASPAVPGAGAGAARGGFPAASVPQQEATSEAAAMSSPDRVQALAVRPDGVVAAIGRATELSVWDLTSGRMVGRLAPPAPAMQATKAGSIDPRAFAGFAGGPAGVDFREMFQSFNPQRNGATGLAFRRDGRVLLASGTYGERLWDLESGKQIRLADAAGARRSPSPSQMNPMALLAQMEMAPSPAAALSPDGRLAARAYGDAIRLVDLTSGAELGELAGHTSTVTALEFSADGQRLVSSGRDGAVRVWSLAEGSEAAALYAVGREDFVAVTPDRYYRVSRNQLHGVSFRVGEQLFPFEQFDLRFDRPDLVMQRLGLAPPALIAAYQRAYEKRVRKMGFAPGALGTELHLPAIDVVGDPLPATTAANSVNIEVRATDDAVALDRINLYVNDVPVYGAAGLSLAEPGQVAQRELEVPLVAGHNKIQVSVLNKQGAESLRRTLYTTSTASREPWDVWVVAVGVSAYRNPRYALRFAAKDAADVAQAFRALDGRLGVHRTVHVRLIADQEATSAGIQAAKQWLQQAQRQDLAVVFAAGHGIVDDRQNYFYGTWDIDADNPGAAGLPFEDFEDLLDGIPPLRKVLLVDTCFSGEIDKDEVRTVAAAEGGARVTMREYKAARNIVSLASASAAPVAAGEPAAALTVQQDLFADLRRGSGAVVISSSSGSEYSLEGAQWGNGVFSYAILQGLTAGRADRDGDGVVTVSELQSYVIDQVRQLTRGAQNPTVRRENLDFDFDVY